ncbi:MAG: hypothetical protein ACE5FY_00445 [Nitrospiria bacterium]
MQNRQIPLLLLFIFNLILNTYVIPIQASDKFSVQFDYITDNNGRTFQDKFLRLDYQRFYLTGFLGNWQKGGELGGYFSDKRKAAYNSYIRIREFDMSTQIGTEQPLRDGYVAKLQMRAIRITKPEKPTDKRNFFVYGIGFDKYYGDYNYFSSTYYNDPRKSGRFSIVISNTLATGNTHLRFGLVPRSDGTLGYFASVKYQWVQLGYSFTKEFDFATFSRKVFTIGLSIPIEVFFKHPEKN